VRAIEVVTYKNSAFDKNCCASPFGVYCSFLHLGSGTNNLECTARR